MRSDEFVQSLSSLTKDGEQFDTLRKSLPLGVDSVGNTVCARKAQRSFSARHTCVTGSQRSEFIRRLLVTLSCLYERSKLCVFVLSTRMEYGELLRMREMEITAPYIRTKADVDGAMNTLRELLRLREQGKGFPRLILVLDGLEEIEGFNRNDDLEEYRAVFDWISRREDVDVITGVELTKSIFSGYPGAFVGVGNCLVATRETGKADVTFVQEDASVSMPMPITYPSAPSLTETILLFNSLSKGA